MPWEWIVLLIVAAALLFLAPSKLPELMRTIGRAWGEFRKGKMEVEREIRAELARDEGGEVLAVRDEVMRAARTLSVPTEGKDMKEIKLGIAKAIDTASTSQVIATAKAFGLTNSVRKLPIAVQSFVDIAEAIKWVRGRLDDINAGLR